MRSKKGSIIKIILISFFVIFFAFLFWYFYRPSENKSFTEKIKDDFSLFPFGDFSPKDRDFIDEEPKKDIKQPKKEKEKIPRLRQISNKPTAGVYFDLLNKEELKEYNKKLNKDDIVFDKDNVSEIRYILSKNGHIYSTYTNTLKENRISNITIPKIYETLFFNKNNFIVRYLDNKNNIKSYSIILTDKTEEELKIEEGQSKDRSIDPYIKNFNGLFLPNNIMEITVSPDKSEIFYLEKKKNIVYGIKSKKWGEEKKQISKLDFSEWNIDWVAKDKILFTSKPSKKTYSLSLIYDINKKLFTKISKTLLAGNTLANNDFSKILYSGIFGNEYSLYVYDIYSNKRTNLNKETLVDKCVWSKNNIDVFCAIPNNNLNKEQPDAWYRGYNYFKDSIYKINTYTKNTTLIYSRSDNDPFFDMTDLKLDDSENYIYWIDKKTGYAWSWQIYEELEGNDDLIKELEDLDKKLNDLDKKVLGGGQKCPNDQIITQNMKAGDSNGKYSQWQKGIINEVNKLQAHMNRLGFSAGEEDGVLGKNTDGAIKKMQKFLGTYQDGKVGPITRELINNSCGNI